MSIKERMGIGQRWRSGNGDGEDWRIDFVGKDGFVRHNAREQGWTSFDDAEYDGDWIQTHWADSRAVCEFCGQGDDRDWCNELKGNQRCSLEPGHGGDEHIACNPPFGEHDCYRWPKEDKPKGVSGCPVCGINLVLIRGKHPFTDPRRVCPTCLQERMESLHELSGEGCRQVYLESE